MPLPLLLMATAVLLLVEAPRPGGLSLLPLLPLLLLALLSTPVVGRWLHRLACAPELSLIHISEPTRRACRSRMPSSA